MENRVRESRGRRVGVNTTRGSRRLAEYITNERERLAQIGDRYESALHGLTRAAEEVIEELNAKDVPEGAPLSGKKIIEGPSISPAELIAMEDVTESMKSKGWAVTFVFVPGRGPVTGKTLSVEVQRTCIPVVKK